MIRNHHIAALLASVALTACSQQKEETAQPAAAENTALTPGFYKAANGSAAVFDVPLKRGCALLRLTRADSGRTAQDVR